MILWSAVVEMYCILLDKIRWCDNQKCNLNNDWGIWEIEFPKELEFSNASVKRRFTYHYWYFVFLD